MSRQKNHIIHLENIEKKNNFNVPDGYFHQFPDRLHEKINGIKPLYSRDSGKFKLFSINKLALAASLTGFIFLLYTGISYMSKINSITNQGNDEIADVIHFPTSEIDDQMLFELYSATPSEDRSDVNPDRDEIISTMIEYILYTNVDVSSLIKEL